MSVGVGLPMKIMTTTPHIGSHQVFDGSEDDLVSGGLGSEHEEQDKSASNVDDWKALMHARLLLCK